MRSAAKEKALQERQVELRAWKRWRRERFEALLQGPYGEAVQALLMFCKTMNSPGALIDFVKAGPWLNIDDVDVRFQILSLLDSVIVRRRERMGLVPFDDALPGLPDNLFLILRELLAPPPGAQPGSIDDSTAKIQEPVT